MKGILEVAMKKAMYRIMIDRLVVLMQGNNPIADYGTVQERSAQLYKTDLE